MSGTENHLEQLGGTLVRGDGVFWEHPPLHQVYHERDDHRLDQVHQEVSH